MEGKRGIEREAIVLTAASTAGNIYSVYLGFMIQLVVILNAILKVIE